MNAGHGTIVLAYLSQREGIVAADSRVTRRQGRITLQFDSCCKIVALSNHVLVALSGIMDTCTVIESPCDWKGTDVAQEAFRNTQSTDAAELVQRLADTWSTKMSELLWKTYFFQPKRAALEAPDNAPLAAAFFIAIDRAGIIHCVAGQVSHETFATIRTWPETRTFPIPPPGHWSAPFMGNGAPIVREFLSGGTKRADEERSHWVSAVAHGAGTAEEMEHIAIRLVELTIRLMPPNKGERKAGVGGPIDAAKLTPNGVTWLRQKTDCRQQK